jgi:hypothetical protein
MNMLEKIQRCFQNEKVYYTFHARQEMEQEEYGTIQDKEINEAIERGEIIESYPDDLPYPSALVLGFTETNRPLHIVCGYDEDDDLSIIITAYQPNPMLWIGYRRRKP